MATAQLERIQTQNIPMALFCYFILMWVPITISTGFMLLWNHLGNAHGREIQACFEGKKIGQT